MSRLLIALLFLPLLAATHAAEKDFYEDWMTNLDAALEKAEKQDKLVFAEFADTYRCPYCVRFRENVLSDKQFQEFAEENLVRVLIDNPRKENLSEDLQKQNMQLWKKYNVRGTPTVVVMDGQGDELMRHTGYSGSKPERWLDALKEVQKKEFTAAE